MANEYEIRLDIALDALRQREVIGTRYCFSISGEYNDGREPVHFIQAQSGKTQIDGAKERCQTIIRQLKPSRLVLKIFKGDKETLNADKTFVIELPEETPSEKKEFHQNDILASISELIAKTGEVYASNQALNGVVQEKTSNLVAIKHEHERSLVDLKHQIEIDRKNELIDELKNENAELKAELDESVRSLNEFQKIYDGEQKIASGARAITQVLQGVASVAPGLISWAQKTSPALGSFASALVSVPQNQMPDDGSQDQIDFQSPEFLRMQKVLEFFKSLTEHEANLFFGIVLKIEENKGLLETITDLIK